MELTFEEELRRSDLIHKLKQSKISAEEAKELRTFLNREKQIISLQEDCFDIPCSNISDGLCRRLPWSQCIWSIESRLINIPLVNEYRFMLMFLPLSLFSLGAPRYQLVLELYFFRSIWTTFRLAVCS